MAMVLSILRTVVLVFFSYIVLIGVFGLWIKKRGYGNDPKARFAIIIPAHNERKVIGNLLDSIRQLDYPQHLYDVYVVADNCSDDTCEVAASKGVHVMERFDHVRKGKGYALQFAFDRLGFTSDHQSSPNKTYNAAVIFDADNLVAANLLRVMNTRLLSGEKIIQCYVDSKNPDDSWVAAASSMMFWFNDRFAMLSRYNLGLCAALAGTGMCISSEVLNKVGWSTTTLTEDLEYSMKALVSGFVTTFAYETRIYDEKPLSFQASWKQRLRWARGQINVAIKYVPPLFWHGLKECNFVKLESSLRLSQLFMIILGGVVGLIGLIKPELVGIDVLDHDLLPIPTVISTYLWSLLSASLVAIDRPPLRPFRFLPFFPLFMYSSVLIVLIGMLTRQNTSWMPTTHTRGISLSQFQESICGKAPK